MGHQQLLLQFVPSEYSLEVELLLGLPHHCCSVCRPGEVLGDVSPHEFKGGDSLHTVSIDEEVIRFSFLSPEIQDHLLVFFLC